MTPQEIFDTVATHLFAQGERAIAMEPDTDICAYRTSDGKKCAVGCLIPDELYDPGMEGHSALGLVNAGFLLPSFFDKNLPLLDDLQFVHDEISCWDTEEFLRAELAKVADTYNLSTKTLSQLTLYRPAAQ